MAAKQANLAERKWMDDITEWAQENMHVLFGHEYSGRGFQRHHVVGRSAKQNKIGVGHFFILPIPFALHDVSSNHPLNVTHRKKAFTAKFGMQRDLFATMYHSMMEQGYSVPSIDVFNAIMSTYE